MLIARCSSIDAWFLFFGSQLNKSPDRFGTGREVGLGAPPVVYHPQKVLRNSHLKHAILRSFRWPARGALAAGHFECFERFVLTRHP
jgi:hypothetical protein